MDNPAATGGAATFGRHNLIQNARLRPLASHRQVALEAAASATAHWPAATSWERQAELLGRWVDGHPIGSRGDSRELDLLIEENNTAGEIERESWYELDTAKRLRRAARMRQQSDTYRAEVGGLRVDHRMDSIVATKAIDVVQAMAAVSRAWPRLSPKGRALAQQITQLAALALRQAGVKPTGPAYGEAV